jgi:hypothetical protein
MIPPTVALFLAAALVPADGAATGSGLAPATEAAERLALPPGTPASLLLDAMGGSLFLPSSHPAPLHRALAGKSTLCPTVELEDGGVRLRCRTRRLAAGISSDRRGPSLELRELRGVPWRKGDDAPPFLPWDPVTLGGSPCPGTTPVVRGECALARGAREEATRHFLDALAGPERSWAVVRLGDLALEEDRLEEAIGWWQAAGTTGRFARLAVARLGELTGNNLEGHSFAVRFDPAGLPWPLGPELTLRAARVDAFLGRTADSTRRLLALPTAERTAVCGWADRLCRRIALEALRIAAGPDREDALALYLSLPGYHRGPLAVELAGAGAEVAASLGAPQFAGNLLSTVAPAVPDAGIDRHLLRTAELYLAGADPVRAGVILEYARTRLPADKLADPRWQAVVTALTAGATAPAPPSPAPEDPVLLRARTALERARAAGETR